MSEQTTNNQPQETGAGADAPAPAALDQAYVLREVWSDDHGGWVMKPVPVAPVEKQDKQTFVRDGVRYGIDEDDDAEQAREDVEEAIAREQALRDQENATPVDIEVPDYLDAPRAEMVQEYLDNGLADVAARASLSSDVANALVQVAVDDAMNTAQVPLDDRDANEVILRNDWGEAFDERVDKVRQFVHRTPGMADFLERTGLGNSPSVVRAIYLHATGITTLSKAEVRTQLDAALKSPAYLRGDRDEVRKVRALAAVLDVGEKAKAPAAAPAPPKPPQASALQAERTRLMQSPAFLDKRHADHAKTMVAYQAVTEKLYPERG